MEEPERNLEGIWRGATDGCAFARGVGRSYFVPVRRMCVDVRSGVWRARRAWEVFTVGQDVDEAKAEVEIFRALADEGKIRVRWGWQTVVICNVEDIEKRKCVVRCREQ